MEKLSKRFASELVQGFLAKTPMGVGFLFWLASNQTGDKNLTYVILFKKTLFFKFFHEGGFLF